MTRIRTVALIGLSALVGPKAWAQSCSDSAYTAVQERGAVVMGVDQYSSSHVFEDLPDGGKIILVRDDATDSAGVATIRAHLRTIADSFSEGVFRDPAMVHAREVPGTAEMAKLRQQIHYQVTDRPGGAELRITSSNHDALEAIHSFLAFQRMDHHAAGHEGGEHHH
jgi:hypothetical protein